MAAASTQAETLAAAYRAAVKASDRLPESEQKILRSMVAQSGAAFISSTQARYSVAEVDTAPVERVVRGLSNDGNLHRTVASIEAWLFKEAKALMWAALSGAAFPLWVGVVAAFAAGIAARAFDVGRGLGLVLALFVACAPPVLAIMFRGAQGLAAATKGASEALGGTWKAASSVGVLADLVWNEHVGPVRSSAALPVPAPTISATVRGYAQTVALASYLALAAAGVFMVAGVLQGFGEGAETPAFCTRFPTSPTCVQPLPTEFTLDTDFE
jgi:hypothetical protein